MKVHELFESEERTLLSVFGERDYLDAVGDLNIVSQGLTSLVGSPKRVPGTVYAGYNNLTNLKGGPEYVGGDFFVTGNPLVSLEGAPSSVRGTFKCENTKITSLHNIHKQVKFIGEYFLLTDTEITSCILGVLLIEGLQLIQMRNKPLQNIINKHLKGERDVFACQEELINAGFEELAQL